MTDCDVLSGPHSRWQYVEANVHVWMVDCNFGQVYRVRGDMNVERLFFLF